MTFTPNQNQKARKGIVNVNFLGLKAVKMAAHLVKNADYSREAYRIQPTALEPKIDHQYKRMGEFMGICPHELQAIMRSEFQEEHELAVSMLKRFVAAVKLSGTVDLSGVHRDLKTYRLAHESEMIQWRSHCKAVDDVNETKARMEIQDRENLRKAWAAVVDHFHDAASGRKLNEVTREHRLMARVLARQTVEAVVIEVDGNKQIHPVTIDADQTIVVSKFLCLKVDKDAILELDDKMLVEEAREEEDRWHDFLDQASLNDLMNHLWSMDMDDDRRRDLQFEVLRRRGARPVFDKHGEIDWYASFEEVDLDYKGVQWINGIPYKVTKNSHKKIKL